MNEETKTKQNTLRKAYFASANGCQNCIEGDTCIFAKKGYICSLWDLR